MTSIPAASLIGAVLNGRWRLMRLLGEGGMGAVFDAESLQGEGHYAIKLVHAEFQHEPQVIERFLAEASTTQSLVHPNIARVYGAYAAENGTPYLIMELLHGFSLADVMLRGPMPVQQVIAVTHAILEALKVAHSRQIVHRDLKPDNIFLVQDATGNIIPKLLDFGIAKVMDVAGGMGSKTKTGSVLGTPGYMSPEQLRDSKSVDARSDLWSLGIMTYEMLTGKFPFYAASEFAKLTAILTQELIPIETVIPAYSTFSHFFHRALSKDPAARFQSAHQMDEALLTLSMTVSAPPATFDIRASRAPNLVPTLHTVPTAVSEHQVSHPSMQPPPVAVRSAPPLVMGAPWWIVAVIGAATFSLGFLAGFLAGSK